MGAAEGRLMKQLLKELNLTTGQRVLDVGFGSLEELKALAERVGPEGFVLGLEFDPESARSAKASLPDLPVSVKEGSVLAIPAKDEAFDVVLCKGVLHEVWQLDRAFQELRRVTRPGGRLFIIDFKRFSRLLFAIYRTSVILREGKCLDVWPGFAEGELRRLLSRYGWEVVEFEDLPEKGQLGFIRPMLFKLRAHRSL
jgi:ubiquinone/menaquinone biosynthesis C-methylase UbiE